MKHIKKYKVFEAEIKAPPSPKTEPRVKPNENPIKGQGVKPRIKPGTRPGIKPGTRPGKTPIRRDKPLIKPAPKASEEDVIRRYAKITNQNYEK